MNGEAFKEFGPGPHTRALSFQDGYLLGALPVLKGRNTKSHENQFEQD